MNYTKKIEDIFRGDRWYIQILFLEKKDLQNSIKIGTSSVVMMSAILKAILLDENVTI